MIQREDGSQEFLEGGGVGPAADVRGTGTGEDTREGLVVSEDDRHYAYATKTISPFPKVQTEPRTAEVKLFLDGKEVGRHTASVEFNARPEEQMALGATHLTLSADGSRFAYAFTQKRNVMHIYDNGKKADLDYAQCDRIVISADGKHLAYFVRVNDFQRFLVMDGKEYQAALIDLRNPKKISAIAGQVVVQVAGKVSVNGKMLTHQGPSNEAVYFSASGGVSFLSQPQGGAKTWVSYKDGEEKSTRLNPGALIVELGGGAFVPAGKVENMPSDLPVFEESRFPRPETRGAASSTHHQLVGDFIVTTAITQDSDWTAFLEGKNLHHFQPFDPSARRQRYYLQADGSISFFGIIEKKLARVTVRPKELVEIWKSGSEPKAVVISGPDNDQYTVKAVDYYTQMFPAEHSANSVPSSSRTVSATSSAARRSQGEPSAHPLPTSTPDLGSRAAAPVEQIGGAARDLGVRAGKALSGLFGGRRQTPTPSETRQLGSVAGEVVSEAVNGVAGQEWRNGLGVREVSIVESVDQLVELSAEQKLQVAALLRGVPGNYQAVGIQIRNLLSVSQRARFDTGNGSGLFR